jgi:cobalt/nickel transport system permease protein
MIDISASPESRLIHKLDPRARLLGFVAFATLLCFFVRLPTLLLSLVFAATLIVVVRRDLFNLLKKVAKFNIFILLLLITFPLFVNDGDSFQLKSLSWSKQGFQTACLISLRANSIMLILISFIGGMKADQLGFALSKLGAPNKFSHLLFFIVRYTDLFQTEYNKLWSAMRLRAFKPALNFHTFYSLGCLIGQLLIRSIDRAEHILEAMKCRGYRGGFYTVKSYSISWHDALFFIGSTSWLFLLAFVEWT